MAKTPAAKDKRTMAWRHRTTYTIWYMMVQRCYNPDHDGYWNYGGAGVNVQEDWLYPPYTTTERSRMQAFRNFVRDVGYRPNQCLSLDRLLPPEGTGHYEKGNVRWATSKVQNRNKRNSLFVPDPADPTKKIPVAELAERLGIPYQALRDKLQRAGVWPGDVNREET
jgi:hypothetical protein